MFPNNFQSIIRTMKLDIFSTILGINHGFREESTASVCINFCTHVRSFVFLSCVTTKSGQLLTFCIILQITANKHFLQNVLVTCLSYDSTSDRHQRANCDLNNGQRLLNPGLTVEYQCEKYFTPISSAFFKGRMHCGQNGWIHLKEFKEFSCKPGQNKMSLIRSID